METKGGVDTFRGGCDGLGNDLPAEYTARASRHEQGHGTEEVHLDLLNFKRRRNLGALDLVGFLHTEGMRVNVKTSGSALKATLMPFQG